MIYQSARWDLPCVHKEQTVLRHKYPVGWTELGLVGEAGGVEDYPKLSFSQGDVNEACSAFHENIICSTQGPLAEGALVNLTEVV